MREFWTIRGWGFVAGACVLVFAGHMFYGANTNALSMLFSSSAYILCAFAFALTFRAESAEFLHHHRSLGLLFLFIIVAGFLQLTPYGIGGPHPLWMNVDGPAAVTVDRDATIRALLQFGGLGSVFLFGAALANDTRRARFVFSLLMVAIAVYSVWAFTTFMLAPGTIYGTVQPFFHSRLAASFLSANSAATLFGTFSVLAAAEFVQAIKYRGQQAGSRATVIEGKLRRAVLPGLALVFTMTCLALTASRAGIAVSTAALFILVGWELLATNRQRISWRVPASVFMIFAGVLIAITILSGELAIDRYGSLASNFIGRIDIFEAHWAAFLAAPWSGYGLGTFATVNQLVQVSENWQELNFIGAVHNVFIQALEEAGVVIGTAIFTLVGLILFKIFRGVGRRRRMALRLRAILVVSFIFIGHGITDFALEVPSIALYWSLLLGIGAGLAAPRASKHAGR